MTIELSPQQLIDAYSAHVHEEKPLRQVARDLHVDEEWLRQQFIKRDWPRRNPGRPGRRLSESQIADAQCAYDVDRKPLRQIAADMGVDYGTLRYHFVKRGWKLRGVGKPPNAERNQAIAVDRASGMRMRDLVAKYGITKSRIYRILEAQNQFDE